MLTGLSFEAQQALIQWIAFLLCVAAGYLLSRKAYLPETPLIWVVLAVAVFAFGFIPVLRAPIVILRAPVPLGTLLWGVVLGAVLGLLINQAQRSGKDAAPSKVDDTSMDAADETSHPGASPSDPQKEL